MKSPQSSQASFPQERLAKLAAVFTQTGWSVEDAPGGTGRRPDLIVSRGEVRYAVELKVAEGRPDRGLSLLSQAILQAKRHAAEHGARPLAVVLVDRTSASLARRVLEFQRDYAPEVAVGIVSDSGGRLFSGLGLGDLDREEAGAPGSIKRVQPRKAYNLFSDLNQWMLKVLLAPELPESLLNSPRAEYRSGADLAQAADVSPMSVSRFLRSLEEEGFLEAGSGRLQLVRREELFRRWQAVAQRSSPELRMSYLVPGAGAKPFQALAEKLDACIGLHSAADLLGLGHVSGVVPHLYVRRLSPPRGGHWPGLVPVGPGESPQVVLKQAIAPESLFRGAVRRGNVLVTDVLQVWLDVSAHPSRGAEQAEVLRRGVLSQVFGAGR